MLHASGYRNSRRKPPTTPIAHHFALVFSSLHNGDSVISQHDIDEGQLKEGTFINADTVQQFAGSLTQQEGKLHWLPENVLYEDDSQVCWFRKPSREPESIWIRLTNKETCEIKVRLPGLLFISSKWNNRLIVLAYAGKRRPTQATKLYHAPLCNVYCNGSVCLGSASIPLFDKGTSEFMSQTEHGFLFDSSFTHVNQPKTFRSKAPITTSSHIARWRELAKQDKSPRAHDMTPLNKTLREFIDGVSK